jgi:hypothetical protein
MKKMMKVSREEDVKDRILHNKMMIMAQAVLLLHLLKTLK